MKKIIIVNNNMRIGGVQRSLINLLTEISERYDVTLLLFSPTGEYMSDIPPSIKVIACNSCFRFLGMAQSECRGPARWVRGFLALITRIFGRGAAVSLMGLTQRKIPENYDCAISFLHNAGKHSFYGGCNEFVLRKIRAARKVAFFHCDYLQSGANYAANNHMYSLFDAVAACSEGCKNVFLSALPAMAGKTVVVHNCHNYDDIARKSVAFDVTFDKRILHVVTVARASPEKGIDRGLIAISKAVADGVAVHYHIVGGGPQQAALETLAEQLGIQKQVTFHGFCPNPYPYIKNADLLLIPSLHEAAPMVIDEALYLGVPLLSTNTTSTDDMILGRKCGWVCTNSQDGITDMLLKLLKTPDVLKSLVGKLPGQNQTNNQALEEFRSIIER